MKTPLLLSLITGLTTLTALAQDDSSSQGGGNQDAKNPRKGPPPSRLVLALDADHDRVAGAIDADHDRVITAEEIAGAPQSLVTLDKNGDGQLTPNEFAPKPRRKPHGPNKGENQNDQSGEDDGQQPGGQQERQRGPR